MPETQKVTIRINAIQRGHLKKLADKLQIDQSNVVRLAIARLAEQEGITKPGRQ